MGQVEAFIGFGSNLGDRQKNIDQAVDLLRRAEGVQVEQVSTYLETDPVGKLDQPRFINCVARVHTKLDPFQLHDACIQIEKSMGRERIERWGPRLIDLDILIYGSESVKHPRLTIPHPEIGNRPFVQEGLQEAGFHG